MNCPRGCGAQRVVDQFTEADHGLPGAQEWGVQELACGHYLEGQPHPVATGSTSQGASIGVTIPAPWASAFQAPPPF